MAESFYTYSTSSKNCWLKKFDDGIIIELMFKWNGDVPDCSVTELTSLPSGYQTSTESAYNGAVDAISEYAKIKNRPMNYLPPRT